MLAIHIHIKFRVFHIDLATFDETISSDRVNAALAGLGFAPLTALASVVEGSIAPHTVYDQHGVTVSLVRTA